MELRHLRYFVVLAEELHFGRAATRLHLSQPPLSQQIKDLEEELGAQLFYRTSRRVTLTPQGDILLKEARLILDQVTHLQKIMHQAGQETLGIIHIGFVTSVIHSLLAAALREFHRLHPKVEIHCRDLAPAMQITALKNRVIDVGFIRSPVVDDEIQMYPLSREPLMVALPEDHPQAGHTKVRLKSLARDPFILFPRQQSPAVYDQILSACEAVGFSPILTQEGNEIQSLLVLVSAGLGVTLVPASLQNFKRPGIVYRPLADSKASVELSLAIRKEKSSPPIRSFVDVALWAAKKPASGFIPPIAF